MEDLLQQPSEAEIGDVLELHNVLEIHKLTVRRLAYQRDKLQRFKDWVHAYLDGKGIPAEIDGPHSAEGCRIGDRMDYVFNRIAELEADSQRLRKLVRSAVLNAAAYEEKPVRSEPGPLTGPVWNKVAHILGLGSTSAIELCREIGVDPHADRLR